MKWPTCLVLWTFTLLFFCLWVEYSNHAIIFDVGEKPLDVVTLALIAATLVVTGVGVIAAIVAIWGFKEIRETSIMAARKIAKEVATKVAKDVAEVVAARTSAEAPPLATTAQEAADVVSHLENDDGHNA